MRPSFRIALTYFILSVLWILLSDKILFAVFPDAFHTVSLYKGWLFVCLSAFLLFTLLKHDETRRDGVEAKLKQTAVTDPLTGMCNRLALMSHLEHALHTAQRNHSTFGLIFIDVDNFKHINDTKGHTTGDSFLRMIALRIADNVRSSDIPARFGGDEFVVFVNNSEDLDALSHRLRDAFLEPFAISHMKLKASISIGTAKYPDHGSDIDSIIHAADGAMYKAKASGRGCIHDA